MRRQLPAVFALAAVFAAGSAEAQEPAFSPRDYAPRLLFERPLQNRPGFQAGRLGRRERVDLRVSAPRSLDFAEDLEEPKAEFRLNLRWRTGRRDYHAYYRRIRYRPSYQGLTRLGSTARGR